MHACMLPIAWHARQRAKDTRESVPLPYRLHLACHACSTHAMHAAACMACMQHACILMHGMHAAACMRACGRHAQQACPVHVYRTGAAGPGQVLHAYGVRGRWRRLAAMALRRLGPGPTSDVRRQNCAASQPAWPPNPGRLALCCGRCGRCGRGVRGASAGGVHRRVALFC